VFFNRFDESLKNLNFDRLENIKQISTSGNKNPLAFVNANTKAVLLKLTLMLIRRIIRQKTFKFE